MAKAAKKISPDAQALDDLAAALCHLLKYRVLVILAYTTDDRSFFSSVADEALEPADIVSFLEAAAASLKKQTQSKPARKTRSTKGAGKVVVEEPDDAAHD